MQIAQDLRYGCRILIKSPVFALTAILSLAIGIGASTAVISSTRQVILRPVSPSIKDPDRLARIVLRQGSYFFENTSSYPDYLTYKDQNPAFSDILAYEGNRKKFPIQFGENADSIEAAYVSGNFFSVLGVRPLLGRNLTPEDDSSDNSKAAAVISYDLWREFFSSKKEILGSEIRLNRFSLTVVGIAPEGFAPISSSYWRAPGIYLPLAIMSQVDPKSNSLREPNARWLELIARLKPGATFAQAQSVMEARVKQPYPSYPGNNIAQSVLVYPADRLSPRLQRSLAGIIGMLTIMVSFIMLVPCANVASLLLSRAIDRRKEIAVRTALGAARSRIVRQLLTEALLIGLLAGSAGLLFAKWTTDILANRLLEDSFFLCRKLVLDKELLILAITISIITSLIFGLFPALHVMRVDLAAAMNDKGNEKLRKFRRFGIKNLLVVANIASSIVVLVISGLIMRETVLKTEVDPGYNPDNLLIVPLHLNSNDFSETRARQFSQILLEHVSTQPGVIASGLASFNNGNPSISVSGNQAPESSLPEFSFIGPGFFRSIDIHLLYGRDFTEPELRSGGDGVIINETMARIYWHQQNALGQQIRTAYSKALQVVGVVSDSVLGKDGSFASPPLKPVIYLPMAEKNYDEVSLYIRTRENAKALIPIVRQIILAQDSGFPITGIQTFSEKIETSMKSARYSVIFLGTLGLLALGLASMGLYAIVSYAVGQRKREISIRIAVGAHHKSVLRQLMLEGMQLTASGLAVGLFMAWAIARSMESSNGLLRASYFPAYALAFLLLIPAAVGACYIPARRAVRANPMTALKID